MFLIIIQILLVSCEQHHDEDKAKGGDTRKVETYYYISREAAKRYGMEPKAQIIYMRNAHTNGAVKFYLDKPTQLLIETSQLSDYPITIQDVQSADIDTSEIRNNMITVIPRDVVFQFTVFRDFSKRNAIYSIIDYDSKGDSMIHHAYLMRKEMIQGILKLKTEKNTNEISK